MEALARRGEVLERERRWSLPVALITLAGVASLVASIVAVRSLTGDGNAEFLQAVYEHGSDLTVSSILKGLAFALFAVPLVYMFRAAQARSDRVRKQLIGLIVAAPLFLATASVLGGVTVDEAASDFAAGKATTDLSAAEAEEECRSGREDDADAFREEFGAGKGRGPLHSCVTRTVADDKAANALADADVGALAAGFGLGGRLGLAFALLYIGLWAMRTGLLTRFWGSLAMALGVAALLLAVELTVIWFLYVGFLALGSVPGGKPPAWERGEAVPWPTPGDRVASELEPDSADPDPGGQSQ